MNCMNCGCYIEAESEFCINCGTPAVDDTVLDVRVNPRENALMVMKSPIYLILGISWLVCAVLFLVSAGVALSQSSKLSFWGIGNVGVFWTSIICLIVGIPILLTAIGFMVSAIKSRAGSSSGLGVAKAGFVVSLVFFSIFVAVFAVGIIILIVQIVGYDSYSFYGIRFISSLNESSVAVFWVSVLIIIGLLVMTFVYYAKVMGSMNAVQTAVDQNKCYHRTSMYASVMSFFWGAAPLFTGISLLESLGADGVLFALFLISYSISLLLLGVNVVAFRKIEIFFGADKLYRRPVVGESSVPIAASSDKPVNYCIHCGRTLYGSEKCICGGGLTEGVKPKVPMYESGAHAKVVNYCIHCGRKLYGAENCGCTEHSGVATTPGVLRSTMRGSHSLRTTEEKKSIIDSNTFLGSGGDLD